MTARRLLPVLALLAVWAALPLPPALALPGDYDRSGTVDLTDLRLFTAVYRTFSDSGDLDEEGDADTWVGVPDAGVFAYHFGRGENDATITAINPLAPGDTLPLTVSDADENEKIKSRDTVTVTVTNLRTGETEVIALTETGLRTGGFTGSGLTTTGNTADSASGTGRLYLAAGDSGTVGYADNDWSADTELIYFNVTGTSGGATDGRLYAQFYVWSAGTDLRVYVVDADQNTDPGRAETVTFAARNPVTGETETFVATEVNSSADTFTGWCVTSSDTADSRSGTGILWIKSQDTVTLLYTDPDDVADTGSDTVVYIPQTGSLLSLEDLVISGRTMGIQVDDADENDSSSARDTVSVTVMNEATGETEVFILRENGDASGSFDSQVQTSTNSADSVSGNGVLYTRPNDTVTGYYVDNDCPSDADTASVNMNPQLLPAFVAGLRVTAERGVGTRYRGDPLDGSPEVVTCWVDAIDSSGTIVNWQLLNYLATYNLECALEISVTGAAGGALVLADTAIASPLGATMLVSDTLAENLTISCTTTGFLNNVATGAANMGHINFIDSAAISGEIWKDLLVDRTIVGIVRAVEQSSGALASATGSLYRLSPNTNYWVQRLLPGTYDLHFEPLDPGYKPEFNSKVNQIVAAGDALAAGREQLAAGTGGSIGGNLTVAANGNSLSANGIDAMVAYCTWSDSTRPNAVLATFDAGDAVSGYGSINDYDFPAEASGTDIAPGLDPTGDSSYYVNVMGLDVDGYRLYLSNPTPVQVVDGVERQANIGLRRVVLNQLITFNNSLASYDSTAVAPTYRWIFGEIDPADYYFTIEVTDRSDSLVWRVVGIPENVTQMTYGNATSGTVTVAARPLEQNQVYKWSVRAGLAHNPQVDVQNFIFSYNGMAPDTTSIIGSFTADSFTAVLDNLDSGIATLQTMAMDALAAMLEEIATFEPDAALEYEPVDAGTGEPLTEGAYFVTRQRIAP